MLKVFKRLNLALLVTLSILASIAPIAQATTVTLMYANNAVTTLAAAITTSSPSLQVTGGSGSLFPNIGTTGTNAFYFTLVKNGAPSTYEICLATGRSGDNFTTILRGQLGTTAKSWNPGDAVTQLPTSGDMSYFTQVPQAQSQLYSYAVDTGSANSYIVNLSPAINGHVIGMPIRWKAAHSNTGSSTFNDSIGSATLVTPEGSGLVLGDIVAGGIYTSVWDGTRFQLYDFHRYNFTQIAGGSQIANAQVPLSAVQQYQASLAIAFSQLTGQLQSGQVANSITLPGSPVTTTQATGTSTTQIATTAFANPASSLGANGWRENSDGSIDEWVTVSYPGSGTPLVVTLPHALSVACYEANANSSIGGYQPGIASCSTTSVSLDMTNLGGTSQNFHLRVIGK